jgi:polysaccharide pyruvyl transferase WcaK-like protein
MRVAQVRDQVYRARRALLCIGALISRRILCARDADMAAVDGSAPRRIGVFGNFGSGNLGNDGTLEVMVEFLRKVHPDGEIVCLCANPRRVRDTYGIPALPYLWPRPTSSAFQFFNKLLLKLPGKLADLVHSFVQARRFDLIIMPGTGLFDGISERVASMPYTLFRTSMAAAFWGTKVWIVSAGAAGPIKHPICRWFFRYAARAAEYRSYRDRYSKDFLKKIGFDTSDDAVYPDLVFKLDPPRLPPARQGERPTVGVGVMAYFGLSVSPKQGQAIYQTYIGKLAAFTQWLLDENYDVRLLLGEAVDQKAVDDVLTVVRERTRHLIDNRIIAEPAESLHDLMRQLASADIVVTTRFHNLICALKLGKPVLSIGYQKKNELLMDCFGLGDFCQNIEDLDVEKLCFQFRQLRTRASDTENHIRRRTAEYLEALDRQDVVLARKLVGKRSASPLCALS